MADVIALKPEEIEWLAKLKAEFERIPEFQRFASAVATIRFLRGLPNTAYLAPDGANFLVPSVDGVDKR